MGRYRERERELIRARAYADIVAFHNFLSSVAKSRRETVDTHTLKRPILFFGKTLSNPLHRYCPSSILSFIETVVGRRAACACVPLRTPGWCKCWPPSHDRKWSPTAKRRRTHAREREREIRTRRRCVAHAVPHTSSCRKPRLKRACTYAGRHAAAPGPSRAACERTAAPA